MRTARAERTIPAPPQEVFELLADHEGYDRFRGIKSSRLLKEGEPPPNGTGALRRVRIGPIRLDEQVSRFEPPTRFDYLITEVNVPFQHQGGTLTFTPEDGGTKVEWTSTFRIPTPLIGGAIEPLWRLSLARGFARVLEDVEELLT